MIEEQAVKSPAILIPSPFSSRIHSFSSCTMLSLQCNSFCCNVIRITLPGITQLLPFPTSGGILNEVTIYLTCFLSSLCSEIFSCNSLNLSPRKDHSAKWMISLKSFMQSPAPLFSPQIKFEKKLLCSQCWFWISCRLSLLRFDTWPDHFVLLLCVWKQWSSPV